MDRQGRTHEQCSESSGKRGAIAPLLFFFFHVEARDELAMVTCVEPSPLSYTLDFFSLRHCTVSAYSRQEVAKNSVLY